MNYTLELEDLKNKSKEEIEIQIRYLSEENTDLRQKIRTGKQAENILQDNEARLVQLMNCYLGVGEMERADSLYEVQKDLKKLKGLISLNNYQLDQKEIFRILNNIDSGIGEEM